MPIYGYGSIKAMTNYQDRIDSEIVKTKDDDGQFIYCISISDIKENMLYSPYDLIKRPPEDMEHYDVYYMVTATNLTRIDKKNNNTIETTPTMKWIWEKKMFDMLRKVKLFRTFIKWKLFNQWKKNIRYSKQSRTR